MEKGDKGFVVVRGVDPQDSEIVHVDYVGPSGVMGMKVSKNFDKAPPDACHIDLVATDDPCIYETTVTSVKSKATTNAYRNGWDACFGGKKNNAPN